MKQQNKIQGKCGIFYSIKRVARYIVHNIDHCICRLRGSVDGPSIQVWTR